MSVRTEAIKIKGKEYSLAGTLVLPDKTSKKLAAVIFYHGMVSQSKPRYVKRAEELAKKGIIGLTFDFRGCGESDGQLGEITIADWFDDALLTFDFLAKQDFVDSSRIGMGGKSFGGYMAALVSEKRQVKSMVLQAPAVYPDKWFNDTYDPENEAFREQRFTYRNSKDALNNRAIKAMKQYQNPLLIIGSELDDTCPKQVVEGYYNESPSTNKEIVWIKGADHALRNEQHNNEYTKLMVDWFEKTL